MGMDEKDKNKLKKIRKIIIISASVFLVLCITLVIVFFILFSDKNRSSKKVENTTVTEIIKKNYIKGFENTKNSGEFSFYLPEDDINTLLSIGTKTIEDKHIESIYYEAGEDNHHYFYVDVKKSPIKTRVIFDTVSSIENETDFHLCINEIKMGKTNPTNLLIKKGYLTTDFINRYFEACYLPISFNESAFSFNVNPFKLMDLFPKTEIGDIFFDVAKQKSEILKINEKFTGFSIDFSKFRTENHEDFVAPTYTLPDFYGELKDECELVDFSSMSVGESKTVYSISENELNSLFEDCKVDVFDEITSKLLPNKSAEFSLVGTKVTFMDSSSLKIDFSYSLNGYEVVVSTAISFTDLSTSYFFSNFSIQYNVSSGTYVFNGASNEIVESFISHLRGIFENIEETQEGFFEFNENSDLLLINLESMNNSFTDASLINSEKSIGIDLVNHAITFALTKTL